MTNNRVGKWTKARRRRPGGGRKPRGPIAGKLANFSTRITAETRGWLESEAAASGQSLSQVAERMLVLGMVTRRERERTSPIRALSYLVGQLADRCAVEAGDKHFDWNSDDFIFEAFSRSLMLMLEQLRPRGNPLQDHMAAVHPIYRELLAAPETWAKHAFRQVWSELLTADGAYAAGFAKTWEGWAPPETMRDLERDAYSMQRARGDLGLEGRPPPPSGAESLLRLWKKGEGS